MSPRILIVNGNTLSSENLRARLSVLGDVSLVADNAALDKALGEEWAAVVSEWSMAGQEGPALFSKLKSDKHPVFLYTDRADLVESQAWSGLGVKKAFTHLQRPDLILAVEQALSTQVKSGGLGPFFLVVEDSPTMRQFVKSVLLEAFPNAEMVEADDGRKALAAMKSSRVSLIVTDLQMPGMDGLSFVQLLRNNAVLKKKPVLVLSGTVDDETRASLQVLDKVQVLTKPAKPEALVAAVRTLLG